MPEHDVASFSGQEKADKPGKVNLLVMNTARELAPKLAANSDTFLIVDECHRAGSPMNALALQGHHQAALGLSATPQREYDDGFEEKVIPVLGKIIFTYDFILAQQDNVVVPFDLVNTRVDLLPSEQKKYDTYSRYVASEMKKIKQGKGSEERLMRLLERRAAVSANATMRIPAAAKLAELNRGKRTLIFHEKISTVHKLLDILLKRGFTVTIYHSKINPALRRDNLRLFRRGVFDVLISCRALDEGLNIPETTVAIVASSTASHRQRIQRIGRVLRPSAGKQTATIYTVYATDQEEKRLLTEARKLDNVVSVTWSRITRNDDVEDIDKR